MAEKAKLTVGKQLMKFIADENLIETHVEFLMDTGAPFTRYQWPQEAEAKLCEFMDKRIAEAIKKHDDVIFNKGGR